MGIRLEKPWEHLNSEAIAALPGQLGVYQVADEEGNVLSVGYAGAPNTYLASEALWRKNSLYTKTQQNFFAVNLHQTTAADGTSF